jgi:hypothetical protein
MDFYQDEHGNQSGDNPFPRRPYALDQSTIDRNLTVGKLRPLLADLPEDTPVAALRINAEESYWNAYATVRLVRSARGGSKQVLVMMANEDEEYIGFLPTVTKHDPNTAPGAPPAA